MLGAARACGSGEEALRLMQDESPDLMLLDIQLPGMNGVDVLERAKELDVQKVLAKPVSLEELMSMINEFT